MCQLRVLRLVVSHTFHYKKLDQFGHDHNAKIMEKVRNERARLLSIWSEDESDQDEVVSHQLPDQRRKLVFDNFDFNQNVRQNPTRTLTIIGWYICALRTGLLEII